MTCEHHWEMTDVEMTGREMRIDTPVFYGVLRAVCQNCGAIHEAEFSAEADDLPFEG